jgi:hypothetical protein
MEKTDQEKAVECMNKLIDLANTLKTDGYNSTIVSAAMMSASAVYATFASVGNTGGLTETGVAKVVEAYRQQVEHVQRVRREEDDMRRKAAETDG